MCSYTESREQYERAARPSPVEFFEADAIIHGYELKLVLGRIAPGRSFLG